MENITVTQESPARRAAVAGLAVVGFFALVFIGMVLAIYAARFVPKTASGLSSAAAYLSQVFTPAGTPATLSAVSTSTLPFVGDATSTATSTALVATSTAAAPATTPVAPSAGAKTTTVSPIAGSGTSVGTVYAGTPFGLPNLVATITSVGYLDNNGNFVPSATVYNNQQFAVQFTISNAGTNVSGPWNFSAVLPAKANSNYKYNSVQQQSLNPGDHISYVLHLDAGEAMIGTGLTVSVTADPNGQVTESNESDNYASQSVTVSSSNI